MTTHSTSSSFDESYYMQEDNRSSSQTHVQRLALAPTRIPSFSSFRSRTPSVPSKSPVKRKPLPENASPRLPSSQYSPNHNSHAAVTPRPFSFEGQPPLVQPLHTSSTVASPPLTEEDVLEHYSDLDQSVHNRFRSERMLTSGDAGICKGTKCLSLNMIEQSPLLLMLPASKVIINQLPTTCILTITITTSLFKTIGPVCRFRWSMITITTSTANRTA